MACKRIHGKDQGYDKSVEIFFKTWYKYASIGKMTMDYKKEILKWPTHAKKGNKLTIIFDIDMTWMDFSYLDHHLYKGLRQDFDEGGTIVSTIFHAK